MSNVNICRIRYVSTDCNISYRGKFQSLPFNPVAFNSRAANLNLSNYNIVILRWIQIRCLPVYRDVFDARRMSIKSFRMILKEWQKMIGNIVPLHILIEPCLYSIVLKRVSTPESTQSSLSPFYVFSYNKIATQEPKVQSISVAIAPVQCNEAIALRHFRQNRPNIFFVEPVLLFFLAGADTSEFSPFLVATICEAGVSLLRTCSSRSICTSICHCSSC